ncbi:transposase [Streptomyces sp. KS_5]|uniref:transposase n=1 Tax=Streptomyces TaxID=1883 RepID=UPI0026980B55
MFTWILVTKFRHSVSTGQHLTRREEIMRAVREDFEAADNHAHLNVNLPPKVAVSRLANSLKACPHTGSARSSPT